MDKDDLASDIQLNNKSNATAIIQYFKAVLIKCKESSFGKDAFREAGGLDFMVEYLLDVERPEIIQHASKLLSFLVDGNVCNQSCITRKEVVHAIKLILERINFLPAVKWTVVLASMILFQNSAAQNLFSEEGCIETIMQMYKKYLPRKSFENVFSESSSDENHSDIWLCLNTALCSAVSNPTNDKNQLLCSALFPLSLEILKDFSHSACISSVSSFLTLCIANNYRNQSAFANFNGPLILKESLEKHIHSLHGHENQCINNVNNLFVGNISSIVGIICVATLKHENNSALFGKLGIVSLLMKLLAMELFDHHVMSKICLTLGHNIEAYGSNKIFLMEDDNFHMFLKKKSTVCNHELQSAVKYLIEKCLINDVKTLDAEMDDGVTESSCFPDLCLKNEQTALNSRVHLMNFNELF